MLILNGPSFLGSFESVMKACAALLEVSCRERGPPTAASIWRLVTAMSHAEDIVRTPPTRAASWCAPGHQAESSRTPAVLRAAPCFPGLSFKVGYGTQNAPDLTAVAQYGFYKRVKQFTFQDGVENFQLLTSSL